MIKRLMRRIENKKTNKLLNDYPCSDFLHNALRFISQGKSDVAYDEICHAIIKCGGELTEREKEFRKRVNEDVD